MNITAPHTLVHARAHTQHVVAVSTQNRFALSRFPSRVCVFSCLLLLSPCRLSVVSICVTISVCIFACFFCVFVFELRFQPRADYFVRQSATSTTATARHRLSVPPVIRCVSLTPTILGTFACMLCCFFLVCVCYAVDVWRAFCLFQCRLCPPHGRQPAAFNYAVESSHCR